MSANTGFRAADIHPIYHHPNGEEIVMPREASGPASWYENGTAYVLRFTSDHVRGFALADEMDTVLLAVDALTGGEEIPGDSLRLALRDLRRLRTRLDAVADELLLYAREAGDDGRPRLSFRDIAAEVEQHHTTVAERVSRVARGEFAAWRNWLVQHTERDGMYPTADGRPASAGGRSPVHLPAGKKTHRTEVYDVPAEPGKVFARCLADGCAWQTSPMSNVVTAASVGSTHEVAPDPVDPHVVLCGASSPDGDTRCVAELPHEGDSLHLDVIGRTWPVAQTLTGRSVCGPCGVCGRPLSGPAMALSGDGWAHESCHPAGEGR